MEERYSFYSQEPVIKKTKNTELQSREDLNENTVQHQNRGSEELSQASAGSDAGSI